MNTAPCQLMGILNLTPDSFSDGGKFDNVKKAVQQVKKMIKEGVDIIDIGGESSAPGSGEVSVAEELQRVIPVIQEIKKQKIDIRISVDTYKAEVARQCLALGVEMINDITALRGDPNLVDVLRSYKPYVVLMYSKDKTARTTFHKEEYNDVVIHIKKFLLERARIAIRYGIPKDKIILDPGLGGFLTSTNDPKPSFQVIDRLKEFKKLGYPILISPSKKSFLGGEVHERGIKTIAASSICVYNGADYLRIHDVKDHRDVVDTVGECFSE